MDVFLQGLLLPLVAFYYILIARNYYSKAKRCYCLIYVSSAEVKHFVLYSVKKEHGDVDFILKEITVITISCSGLDAKYTRNYYSEAKRCLCLNYVSSAEVRHLFLYCVKKENDVIHFIFKEITVVTISCSGLDEKYTVKKISNIHKIFPAWQSLVCAT
jgi:hypothetical protein